MTQIGASDDDAAEKREYEFAKAYTERKLGPLNPGLRIRHLAVWLLLALAPMGYAGAVLLLTNSLSGAWLDAWISATAGFPGALSHVFAGIGSAGAMLYPKDPRSLMIFEHFAGLDVALIVGGASFALAVGPRPRIDPRPDSVEGTFLNRTSLGFPLGRGLNPRRVGGKFGGLLFALMIVLLAPLALYYFYVEPLFHSGQFFIDAHSHCAAYNHWWFDRNRECVQYSENSLGETVWKLGWMSGVAVALIPVMLWLTLAMLVYPIWLLRQRRERL